MLRPFSRVAPNGSGQASSGATGAAGSEATYNSRLACLKNAVAFALFRLERTSSANGAFGRQDRHDNAGIRLLTAA